jgi:hypothetical protein
VSGMRAAPQLPSGLLAFWVISDAVPVRAVHLGVRRFIAAEGPIRIISARCDALMAMIAQPAARGAVIVAVHALAVLLIACLIALVRHRSCARRIRARLVPVQNHRKHFPDANSIAAPRRPRSR